VRRPAGRGSGSVSASRAAVASAARRRRGGHQHQAAGQPRIFVSAGLRLRVYRRVHLEVHQPERSLRPMRQAAASRSTRVAVAVTRTSPPTSACQAAARRLGAATPEGRAAFHGASAEPRKHEGADDGTGDHGIAHRVPSDSRFADRCRYTRSMEGHVRRVTMWWALFRTPKARSLDPRRLVMARRSRGGRGPDYGAGDREQPRRPLPSTLSGAAALPLPDDDE
jgi:hypothetical protein